MALGSILPLTILEYMLPAWRIGVPKTFRVCMKASPADKIFVDSCD